MAATQVASSRATDASAVRIRIWRVMSMLAALAVVVVSLLVILTSAA